VLKGLYSKKESKNTLEDSKKTPYAPLSLRLLLPCRLRTLDPLHTPGVYDCMIMCDDMIYDGALVCMI
jgi:hypothetical protein